MCHTLTITGLCNMKWKEVIPEYFFKDMAWSPCFSVFHSFITLFILILIRAETWKTENVLSPKSSKDNLPSWDSGFSFHAETYLLNLLPHFYNDVWRAADWCVCTQQHQAAACTIHSFLHSKEKMEETQMGQVQTPVLPSDCLFLLCIYQFWWFTLSMCDTHT